MLVHAERMPLPGCGLEEILDSLPLAIYIKDKDLRYTWGNTPFGQLCQCQKEGIEGNDAATFFDERLVEIASEHDYHVMATGETRIFDADVTCCGKERSLRFVKIPARASDGTVAGVISFAMDQAHASPGERELMDAMAALQAENERLKKLAMDLESSLRFAEENAAHVVELAENTALERDRISDHAMDLEASLAYTEEQAARLAQLAEELEQQRQDIAAHNEQIQQIINKAARSRNVQEALAS